MSNLSAENVAVSGDLRVDPDRGSINCDLHGHTGIYIRAIGLDGKWGSYDIAELDRASLLSWVKGKDRLWLENLVLVMLGHNQ
jgi:hypothetical protein